MPKAGKKRRQGFETSLEPIAALIANALTLATLLYAWILLRTDSDLYYRSVQEDQALEWASFLAFLGAAILFGLGAWRQRAATGRVPWFLAGLGLFCFVVAMEEISWAQRVFAYRPPAYFLEHNFQQELNLHNIVDTDYRKLAVKVVLLGYGVIFPLIARFRPLPSMLSRWAIVPPPLGLVPLFLVSHLVYVDYTWEFTGEWIELMMGLGLMFAAMPPVAAWRDADADPERPGPRQRLTVGGWWLAVVLGGALLAFASEGLRGSQPELVDLAEAEGNALRLDFLGLDGACQGKRHLNKRIYSYIERYGEEDLLHGAFAALVGHGMPEERAQFFLDPWNSPYWVQCTRSGERRFGYVYSFGPNRRRESTEWEILGDDVGAVFLSRGVD